MQSTPPELDEERKQQTMILATFTDKKEIMMRLLVWKK